MPGVRKAAVVLLLMGEEVSAQIFKHLSEPEIETLAREMAALGPVSPSVSEKVIEEFHSTAIAAEYVTRGDVEYARRVLVRTLGQEAARRIIDRVQRSFQSTAGFT